MKLAMLMDDIGTINPKKDSSLAMLIAAKKLNYELFIFNNQHMFYKDKAIFAKVAAIDVFNDKKYFNIKYHKTIDLSTADIILMRKDPPFDMNYIYSTYMLEYLVNKGVKVINNPKSLRDFNEKFTIISFPQLIPPTLVSSDYATISSFAKQFNTFILKPLDAMGGDDVFKKNNTDNILSIVQYLTNNQTRPIMVQKFIPEISNGDKRIILIKGKPIPYALARIPAHNSFKGNLAQGASFEVRDLTKRDEYICQQLKSFLIKHKLDFVGIDVIGDYLTEINITSPTGIKEIDSIKKTDIAAEFLTAIKD